MTHPAPLLLLSPLHRAVRQVSLDMEGRLEHLEMPSSAGHLLTYLRSYAPCPVGELARVFGLRGSTLTGMLDRLEERGLLLRELDPNDRRSFLLDLTEEGLLQATEIGRVAADLEGRILDRVDARDLAGFERVMDAIGAETRVEVRPKETT